MTELLLVIYTEEKDHQSVAECINSIERLDELVEVRPIASLNGSENAIVVENQRVTMPLCWSGEEPPYLFAPYQLNRENLLTLIFLKLQNLESAYNYAAENAALLREIDNYNRLLQGIPFTQTETATDYRTTHNQAVMQHYGESSYVLNPAVIEETYRKALHLAPNEELWAFTAKQLISFLADTGQIEKAGDTLEKALQRAVSDEGTIHLKSLKYALALEQLAIPYQPERLDEIKTLLWEVLTYFEKQQQDIQIALCLLDAARVANYSNSFAEALQYLTRARAIFVKEALPEMVGNTDYQKGILLYTWAQQGSPQFYKPAMESYQLALKTFTFENAPEVFSEIQHHLGVIYSEIPGDAPNKGLWAAVSVSSFNQAMNYFTPETHPYEYAMICNSYGNALTKFPEAVLGDNHAKALAYYRKSLAIRNAHDYPEERVLTIMNFLEAAWYVRHETEYEEYQLFAEMEQLAAEIKVISTNAALIEDVDRQLQKIEQLKKVMQN